MRLRFGMLATIGAAVAVTTGVGAAGASAYAISGGGYVGSGPAFPTMTFGGAYTFSCGTTTYAGTATGGSTTSFTPTWGKCSFFGLPATATASGAWGLTVVAGPDLDGYYDGELTVPAGATVVYDFPLGACVATISGSQTLSHGVGGTTVRMRNVGSSGVELAMTLEGFAYGVSGPCFAPGTDGRYATNGVVTLPGITIS